MDGEDNISNLHPDTGLTRDPWQHLATGSAPLVPKPARATAAHAHRMAVSMETWLVADAKRLADYYGAGFQASALPTHAQLENVAKTDLNQRLVRATSNTKKGHYSKGSHSFDLLATIVPAVMELKLPHAKRFFDVLREQC